MNTSINLRQRIEWSRASSQALLAYFKSHTVRKLQIGSGTNVLDGWFNTDIVPSRANVFFLDSTQHFPIDNETFDYIFSEHHLEHLTHGEGLLTLQECYRVLSPGGKIRIATPSLEVLLGLYGATPNDLQQRYIQFITDTFLPEVTTYNPVFVINNAFHNWGHKFLYDQRTLHSVLEDVGFVSISLTAPSKSDDEQLCNIEKHGQFIGNDEVNRFETMVLEAKRPL